MKRALFVLVVLATALGMVAATKALPPEVQHEIQRALVREHEAVALYQRYAVVAEEEGYRGVAALFRAQARAEQRHADRFAALLQEHEISLLPEEPVTVKVGTTRDNLRAAAAAERSERDGSYRQAVEICNFHGAQEIAKVFDQTRDSEVEHSNLCDTAARNLESMKEAKTFYVCDKCGYTTDVKLSYCAVCRHRQPPVAVE